MILQVHLNNQGGTIYLAGHILGQTHASFLPTGNVHMSSNWSQNPFLLKRVPEHFLVHSSVAGPADAWGRVTR